MEDDDKPGQPRPPVEKPQPQNIQNVNFQYSELFFVKAIKSETADDLLLMFSLEEFYVLIGQIEFFLYQQELFTRCSEAEERGEEYRNICLPDAIFYDKKNNKPIYLVTNLLDGLTEMEEEILV